MKITSIEPVVVNAGAKNWLFVQVATDEGIVGLGEGTLEGKPQATVGAIEDFSHYLVGRDPFRIEYLWRQMYRYSFWQGGPVLGSAISGLEHALWDILGKSLGVPVYRLLGGPCFDRLPAYATGWMGRGNDPDEIADNAHATVEKGFRGLKCDPCSRSADRHLEPEELTLVVNIMSAVREAVGPSIELYVDLHGRFNTRTAIDLLHRFEGLDLKFVEEPIPPDSTEALKQVAAASRIPLAAGERRYTRYGFTDLIASGAVTVIQPDVCHAGGIMECKKISAMAEAAHLTVTPHNPNGPVSTAATVHWVATTPNLYAVEMQADDVGWRRDVVQGEPVVENGTILLPTAPGLGVELNLEACRAHPHTEKGWKIPDEVTT